jgi:hypothetical protein
MATQMNGSKPSDLISLISSRHRSWFTAGSHASLTAFPSCAIRLIGGSHPGPFGPKNRGPDRDLEVFLGQFQRRPRPGAWDTIVVWTVS